MGKFSEKLLFGISKLIVKTYTGAMLDMDVHKKSPFPAGAKIIAPNHPSTTDPFFIAGVLNQQSFIMIKDVLFKVPILGEYLRRSGHIEVAAGRGQDLGLPEAGARSAAGDERELALVILHVHAPTRRSPCPRFPIRSRRRAR